MKTTTMALLASAVLALAMPARASNLITNGSFEVGTPSDNPYDSSANSQQLLSGDTTSLSGWTVTGAASSDIAWIGSSNTYGVTASQGSDFLDLTGWQWGGAGGKGVMQTISTVAGQQYTLSFDLGNSISYNYGGTNALSVQAGSLSQVVSSVGTQSVNAWDHYTLSFVAQSASTAVSFTGVQATYYIGLDNVSVTAVPEPETFALLLAGLGVVGAVARRRKATTA